MEKDKIIKDQKEKMEIMEKENGIMKIKIKELLGKIQNLEETIKNLQDENEKLKIKNSKEKNKEINEQVI